MTTDNDRAQAHIENTARQIATDEAVLGIKPTTLQQDLGSLAADLATAGNHEGAALVTAAVNAMTKVDQSGVDERANIGFSPMHLAPIDGTPVLLHMPTTGDKFAVGRFYAKNSNSILGLWGDDEGNYYVHDPVGWMSLRVLEGIAALQAQPSAPADPNAMPVADVREYTYAGIAKNGVSLEVVLRDNHGLKDGDSLYATPADMPASGLDGERQRAHAWESVARTLERLFPRWTLLGGTGEENAVKAITMLVDAAAPQQPVAASSEPRKFDNLSLHQVLVENDISIFGEKEWMVEVPLTKLCDVVNKLLCTNQPAPAQSLTGAAAESIPMPTKLLDFIYSADLYAVLMDVQNGCESVALPSMANKAIVLLDDLRGELRAPLNWEAHCKQLFINTASQPSAPADVAAVREDWKLVPIDPTDEMTFIGQSMRYDSSNSIGSIYCAMLDAAPTAQPQAEQAGEKA